MAEPLVIQFAADTSRAQGAMASLAASIAGNMASAGVALSGLAANSNSTGSSLGSLQQNVQRAAGAIGSDVKNIASATANAVTAEKATLEGVVRAFTTSVVTSNTAVSTAKAGVAGLGAAVAPLVALAPGVVALAGGFLAFEAGKIAIEVFTAAVAQAAEELARMYKIGADAARLGVSTTFLQTYSAQARSLKVDVETLAKTLETARSSFTVLQGSGGESARNESAFGARLRQQAAAGNLDKNQVARFDAASGTEAQLRVALDLMVELQAKGRDLAALDLASKIFPPQLVDRIRQGTLDLDRFRKTIDDVRNPDLVLIKPEEIIRAQELQRRMEDAKATLETAAKEFNLELARAGYGLQESAISWKETMSAGARAAVEILRQARIERESLTANEPAVYGRDYFRPEDAPKSGLLKDLGPAQATVPKTGDQDRDAALNRLRGNLGNPTLIEQAQAASLALGAGLRPDKSSVIRTDHAKSAGGGSNTERLDAVENLISQIEKARDTAKAELDNVSKTNVEREKAVALAKAEAVAREEVKKGNRESADLTEDERKRVLAGAEAWQTYKDRTMDAQQAIRQAADAARYFGDAASTAFADAILEGKSFSDILNSLVKQFARSALQGVFTGQGPLSGLLGTASKASSGDSVGGLAGLFSSFFRANGGPVSAGQAYTVGERGREMFIPNANGQIVPIAPQGSGGGSVTSLNFIDMRPAGSADLAPTTRRNSSGGTDILLREAESGLFSRGRRGQGALAPVLNTAATRTG